MMCSATRAKKRLSGYNLPPNPRGLISKASLQGENQFQHAGVASLTREDGVSSSSRLNSPGRALMWFLDAAKLRDSRQTWAIAGTNRSVGTTCFCRRSSQPRSRLGNACSHIVSLISNGKCVNRAIVEGWRELLDRRRDSGMAPRSCSSSCCCSSFCLRSEAISSNRAAVVCCTSDLPLSGGVACSMMRGNEEIM